MFGLLLCHPQGWVQRRPSVDPFVSRLASCAAASLLSVMRPGLPSARPLCCYPNSLWENSLWRSVCDGAGGWGRHLSGSRQRQEIRIDRVEFIVCTHTRKRLMSLEQLLSNPCLSKLSFSFLTRVQKTRGAFFYFAFVRSWKPASFPAPPLLWPLGPKHRELIITSKHTAWNR